MKYKLQQCYMAQKYVAQKTQTKPNSLLLCLFHYFQNEEKANKIWSTIEIYIVVIGHDADISPPTSHHIIWSTKLVFSGQSNPAFTHSCNIYFDFKKWVQNSNQSIDSNITVLWLPTIHHWSTASLQLFHAVDFSNVFYR